MHKHLRLALATAASAALTGGLLTFSAVTATAADSVHHHEADFNGDGYGDVAYSAGSATVGGKKAAGQIVALYGSANGVTSTKRKTISQNTTGVPGGAETEDGFGWVSAYGDFNSDGYDDLAVATPWEDVSGDKDGGTVAILWGSSSGLTGGTTIKDPAPSSHDKWGRSLAAGDFDGDGHADLFAVQNSSAPVPFTGRFDSGLGQFIRGDGHGGWTLRGPAESGLVVRGDAKALAVLDLDRDGWPDFLTTRNNDTTLAFRNGGVAGRRSFGVRLQGAPGNPTAVGARITVALADGSTQTSEVHAGSGYFSQSSATCFFGHLDTTAVRRITVRWPDGSTTTADAPAPAALITLAQP
jgi:hypothetical protein